MTPVEIALVSVIAYMTGVFSGILGGILGGIRLRKSMLRSLSREHLSSDAPPVSVPGPVQAPVPLVQEIVASRLRDLQDLELFR